MTMKIIRTVVFSCGEGVGNPCPVALEADSLSDAAMQEEARSWGSEGTFVLKPTRPDCAVRFRYFAPQKEHKGGGSGHEAQAANLDQAEDHRLAKAAPLGEGVVKHQTGHAHR